MIFSDTIALSTKGFSDALDITGKVLRIVQHSGIKDRLVTIFCKGSTGAVTTIEYEAGV